MRLPLCVSCKLPVLELEGQFEKLDSYLIEDGVPAPHTAGYWHLPCLRASSDGAAWHAARLRNYLTVRGFEQIASTETWTVLRDPRRGVRYALGGSGELADLNLGSPRSAHSVIGGVVLPHSEREFHLELSDQALAQLIKSSLLETGVCALSVVISGLGIAERVAHPESLIGAAFRYDRALEEMWATRSFSARLEYGVFVPNVLVPYLGERAR